MADDPCLHVIPMTQCLDLKFSNPSPPFTIFTSRTNSTVLPDYKGFTSQLLRQPRVSPRNTCPRTKAASNREPPRQPRNSAFSPPTSASSEHPSVPPTLTILSLQHSLFHLLFILPHLRPKPPQNERLLPMWRHYLQDAPAQAPCSLHLPLRGMPPAVLLRIRLLRYLPFLPVARER